MVHCARRNDQRLRRIKATGNSDHDLFGVAGLEALGEALHLDIVSLVAVLAQPLWVGRHKWEAIDLSHERDAAFRGVETKRDSAKMLCCSPVITDAIAKGTHAHARRAQ